MKKLGKKQIIILSVVFVVIAIIITMFLLLKTKSNNKTSFDGENAIDVVELEKVEFSNITKKYENGITTIEADILSNNKNKKDLIIEIILKDDNLEEVERMRQVIENIEPGRKKRLQTAILGDYSSIKDIEFKVVEE